MLWALHKLDNVILLHTTNSLQPDTRMSGQWMVSLGAVGLVTGGLSDTCCTFKTSREAR
jgi:hypothetical protein